MATNDDQRWRKDGVMHGVGTFDSVTIYTDTTTGQWMFIPTSLLGEWERHIKETIGRLGPVRARLMRSLDGDRSEDEHLGAIDDAQTALAAVMEAVRKW